MSTQTLLTEYNITILLPLVKPIIGGNLNYLGLMDMLKYSNDQLQINSVLFGLGDQNIWINNVNNKYIIINEEIIVTSNQIYVAYNSSEDNVWEI